MDQEAEQQYWEYYEAPGHHMEEPEAEHQQTDQAQRLDVRPSDRSL